MFTLVQVEGNVGRNQKLQQFEGAMKRSQCAIYRIRYTNTFQGVSDRSPADLHVSHPFEGPGIHIRLCVWVWVINDMFSMLQTHQSGFRAFLTGAPVAIHHRPVQGSTTPGISSLGQ